MRTLKAVALISLACFALGCSSSKSEKEAMSTSADTLSVTGLSGEDVKLVKTADVDFKVKNVYESANSIVRTAHLFNGTVAGRKIGSRIENTKILRISDDTLQVISAYTVRAEMLVQVPAAMLDSFIEDVYNHSSFMNSIAVNVDDKSLEYLAARLKEENRTRVLDNVKTGTGAPAIKPEKLIEQKDAAIDQEITKKQLSTQANYSAVSLVFEQDPVIKKERVANTDLSVYRLSFWKSMSDAFSAGWMLFLNLIIAATHLWMLILAGVLVVVGLRVWKKKTVQV